MRLIDAELLKTSFERSSHAVDLQTLGEIIDKQPTACDKQEEKKVEEKDGYLYCPTCKECINDDSGYEYPYCPECGQKLDWS